MLTTTNGKCGKCNTGPRRLRIINCCPAVVRCISRHCAFWGARHSGLALWGLGTVARSFGGGSEPADLRERAFWGRGWLLLDRFSSAKSATIPLRHARPRTTACNTEFRTHCGVGQSLISSTKIREIPAPRPPPLHSVSASIPPPPHLQIYARDSRMLRALRAAESQTLRLQIENGQLRDLCAIHNVTVDLAPLSARSEVNPRPAPPFPPESPRPFPPLSTHHL